MSGLRLRAAQERLQKADRDLSDLTLQLFRRLDDLASARLPDQAVYDRIAVFGALRKGITASVHGLETMLSTSERGPRLAAAPDVVLAFEHMATRAEVLVQLGRDFVTKEPA